MLKDKWDRVVHELDRQAEAAFVRLLAHFPAPLQHKLTKLIELAGQNAITTHETHVRYVELLVNQFFGETALHQNVTHIIAEVNGNWTSFDKPGLTYWQRNQGIAVFWPELVKWADEYYAQLEDHRIERPEVFATEINEALMIRHIQRMIQKDAKKVLT